MNHRLACLVAAGLALAADPHADVSASVYYPTPTVEILVGGAAQRQYAYQGRWYVEAAKGHEYTIRMRNPYGVRVAVALSVDGLNTIDARQTTASKARKWVLDPYETVTISGWQTSQTEARRFEFTTEERLVRSGTWQDRQPWRDLRGVLQGACADRHQPRIGSGFHAPVGGAARRREARGGARGTRSGRTRSMPRPAWAAGPTTRSPRYGWTSRTRRRRQ